MFVDKFKMNCNFSFPFHGRQVNEIKKSVKLFNYQESTECAMYKFYS